MENRLELTETGTGLFRRPVLQWELVSALGMGPRDMCELSLQDPVALDDMRVRTWKVARMLKHQGCKHEGRLLGTWKWFGTQEAGVGLAGLSHQP